MAAIGASEELASSRLHVPYSAASIGHLTGATAAAGSAACDLKDFRTRMGTGRPMLG